MQILNNILDQIAANYIQFFGCLIAIYVMKICLFPSGTKTDGDYLDKVTKSRKVEDFFEYVNAIQKEKGINKKNAQEIAESNLMYWWGRRQKPESPLHPRVKKLFSDLDLDFNKTLKRFYSEP